MTDRRRRKGSSFFKKSRKEVQKKNCPEYTGTVQMTREGFLFVKIEGQEDDVYVKAGKTGGALNGDTVRVSVTKEKTDSRRREG